MGCLHCFARVVSYFDSVGLGRFCCAFFIENSTSQITPEFLLRSSYCPRSPKWIHYAERHSNLTDVQYFMDTSQSPNLLLILIYHVTNTMLGNCGPTNISPYVSARINPQMNSFNLDFC